MIFAKWMEGFILSPSLDCGPTQVFKANRGGCHNGTKGMPAPRNPLLDQIITTISPFVLSRSTSPRLMK